MVEACQVMLVAVTAAVARVLLSWILVPEFSKSRILVEGGSFVLDVVLYSYYAEVSKRFARSGSDKW